MEINFNYEFNNLYGDILKEPKEIPKRVLCEACNQKEALWAEQRSVTLRRVACSALNANYEDERNLDGEEKSLRGALAERIALSNGSLDLSIEEIAKIKKLIGKGFSPLIVNQSYKVLEGKENKK